MTCTPLPLRITPDAPLCFSRLSATFSTSITVILSLVAQLIYAVVYYFVFYFMITKMNLGTPGREADDIEPKLYRRSDVEAAKSDKSSIFAVLDDGADCSRLRSSSVCFSESPRTLSGSSD